MGAFIVFSSTSPQLARNEAHNSQGCFCNKLQNGCPYYVSNKIPLLEKLLPNHDIVGL